MAEPQAEWMKTTIKVLRIVSAILTLPVIALVIVGIFSYWRDVRNVRVSSDALTPIQRELLIALNIQIPANESEWNTACPCEDNIIVQYGILRNCRYQSDSYRKCEIPEYIGFVGDSAIVALLWVAVAFTFISFILSIASIYYSKITWIDVVLTPIRMIVCFCILAGLTIYLNYYDKAYIIHEDYSTVSFPLQIKLGAGIDVIIRASFSLLFTALISQGALFLALPSIQHRLENFLHFPVHPHNN